jgi:hypothetical protein
MTLAKQVVSIPLQAGVDLENNSVLVSNDRFVSLQNAVFDKGALGQLHKRNGYEALTGNQVGASASLRSGQSLQVFNSELGQTTAPGSGVSCDFYTLPPVLDKWLNHGQIPNFDVARTSIYSGTASATNGDTCTANGVTLYAFELNGQVAIRVLDETSKSVYYQNSNIYLLGAGSYSPKCVAIKISGVYSLVCFTTNASGHLFATVVNPAAPELPPITTATGVTTLTPSAFTNECIYDVTGVGTTLCVVGYVQTASLGPFGAVYVWNVNPTTWAVVSSGNFQMGFGLPLSALCACPLGTATTTQIFIAGVPDGNLFTTPINNYQLYNVIWNVSTHVVVQSHEIVSTQVQAIPRMTCVPYQGGNVCFFWEVVGIDGNVGQINTCITSVASVTSQFVFTANASLCSQPFFVGDGNLYLYVQFVSSVQPTTFLMAYPLPSQGPLTAIVAAKFLSGISGGPPSNNRMPAVTQTITNGPFITSASTIIEEVSVNDKLASITGIGELSLTLGTGNIQGQQLGQNLCLAAGGLLWDYDGSNLVEHGFNVYPEAPVLTRADSFLTFILDVQDPTLTNPQTGRLCVGDNASTPGGAVGGFIQPGEYFCFEAFNNIGGPATPQVFYFEVDGNAGNTAELSSSAFSGYNQWPIAINSNMGAAQVASSIYNAMHAHLSHYTVTFTPATQTTVYTVQTINFVSSSPNIAVSTPSMNTRFSVTQTAEGAPTSGETYAQVCITGCPASLIQNGQYLTFTQSTSGAVANPFITYFWFTKGYTPGVEGAAANVPIIAADPNPYNINGYFVAEGTSVGNVVLNIGEDSDPTNAVYIGINIPLVGNETSSEVASAIADTFFAVQSYLGYDGSIVFGGNTTTIVADSSYVCTPSNFANNPQKGGVETNYVGQNITNVNNTYAAIEYVSVYEWIDGQGQLHQSAPSVPTTINIPTYTTLSGGVLYPNASVNIATESLYLTQKDMYKLATSDVDIAIYRTTTDGQIFYRVTSPTSVVLNNISSAQPVTYLDETSDTSIQSNQPVYTTGGILENDAPPATGIVVNHQDRLWVAATEDPTLWWYSQPFSQGYGIAFSSDLTIRVNPSVGTVNGGNIVAGASMDGNFISMQENLIQYVTGTGPDNTGANGLFSSPQLVASSTSIGCRDPGSVVLSPNGLIFKSTQGFYMLARGLALQYIGAPVKAFNADVVSAATALDTNSQVRFLSKAGTTLVWDWFYNCWGEFTNHQGVASISYDNIYFYINESTGLVYEEIPGLYSDDGAGYSLLVTTAWLKTSNIQGFQRMWKMFVEGFFSGTQQYQVQLAYDYNPTIIDTFVLNSTSGPGFLWGSETPWGSGIWGGGAPYTFPDRRQFRVFPSNQLCESVQMTFQDLSPYNTAVTPALNALDLEVGLRKGGYKRLGPGGSIG